jgi:glycosyltransferase involved in cell wall biosynthesis
MIRFSVITITYNAGAVLGRTIESVAAQDYANVEHIIVDGASTDGTLALAKAYTKRTNDADGHEVKLVSERDRGIYDAMNKGLRLASGDYVVFMNAGDTFHSSDTLTEVANVAMAGADGGLAAVLYGDTDIVDGEWQFICHRRLAPPDRLTWRSFIHGMLVCHQSFYARTDLAKRTTFDLQYRYSADVDWCIRIMREASRLRLPLLRVPKVVSDYMQEGQTTLHHSESLRERFRVMAHHYGFLPTAIMHLWFVVRSLIKR